MFVRTSCIVALACLVPAAAYAAPHRGEPFAAAHAPTILFPIGHGSVSRGREIQLKPLELAPSPKPVESAFPSFSNPLHRHRMALLTF